MLWGRSVSCVRCEGVDAVRRAVCLITLLLLLLHAVVVTVSAQDELTTSPPPIPTTTPRQNCSSRGSECAKCVEDVSCYFCQTVNECRKYPGSRILPNKECPLADTRWAICWLNFEALIISVSVISFLILITISCTIYCCCCRGGGGASKRFAREDKKAERRREELRLKHEERRSDRKAKNDEIRRKYGLVKDDNPYMQFENEKP